MRALLVLGTLLFAAAAPLASATTVTTKSCTLGTSAIVSVGTCSVSGFANSGIHVKVSVDSATTGDVHVDMSNAYAFPDNIEWECALVGFSHSCTRVIDTGGQSAGTWIVSGYYSGADPSGAPVTMSVDFLTF